MKKYIYVGAIVFAVLAGSFGYHMYAGTLRNPIKVSQVTSYAKWYDGATVYVGGIVVSSREEGRLLLPSRVHVLALESGIVSFDAIRFAVPPDEELTDGIPEECLGDYVIVHGTLDTSLGKRKVRFSDVYLIQCNCLS